MSKDKKNEIKNEKISFFERLKSFFKKDEKSKKQKKVTIMTISQSIFFLCKYFLQNGLFSYAAACSFNFLFSFIPVLIMIFVILTRFLHASPSSIDFIFSTVPELGNYFSADKLLSSINSIESIGMFEIIIFFFILWMARRFFASVFDSFHRIFHEQVERTAFSNQLFTILVEVGLIIVVAITIFFLISLRTILTLPFFTEFFESMPNVTSFFNGILVSITVDYFPNILLFLVLFFIFKTVPATKPSKKLSASMAFFCTLTFFLIRMITHAFLNTANYNFIYGVLGQVIITLLDIYTFFMLFLGFAQLMFVFQFFNQLLLGELYILPESNESGFLEMMKRLFFARPDFLLSENENVIELNKNDEVFKTGDDSDFAYFVVSGTFIDITSEKLHHRGTLFGELDCILNNKRETTIKALEDSKLIKIDYNALHELMSKNPQIAKKILNEISFHLGKIDFMD